MMILLEKLLETSSSVSYKYSGARFGLIIYDKQTSAVSVKDDSGDKTFDSLLEKIIKTLSPDFPKSYTYAEG